MTDAIRLLIDASYALAVAGAAMIWPPLALVVAGLYLGVQAIVADRRSPAGPAE